MSVESDVAAIVARTLNLDARASAFGPATLLLGSIPEFDSMAVVNVIAGLEEHFGLSVDDDEISADTFHSVGSLVAFVSDKVGR